VSEQISLPVETHIPNQEITLAQNNGLLNNLLGGPLPQERKAATPLAVRPGLCSSKFQRGGNPLE